MAIDSTTCALRRISAARNCASAAARCASPKGRADTRSWTNPISTSTASSTVASAPTQGFIAYSSASISIEAGRSMMPVTVGDAMKSHTVLRSLGAWLAPPACCFNRALNVASKTRRASLLRTCSAAPRRMRSRTSSSSSITA